MNGNDNSNQGNSVPVASTKHTLKSLHSEFSRKYDDIEKKITTTKVTDTVSNSITTVQETLLTVVVAEFKKLKQELKK